MFTAKTNLAMRTLAGLVGVVTALAMTAGAFAPSAAYAQDSTREVCLAAQAEGINVTSGQFAALCASVLGTSTTSTNGFGVPCTYQFTQNLTLGSRSSEVMNLQRFLNSRTETQVASVGAGSAGQETMFFGNLTRTTLANYQRLNGISPAVGYFGPLTRANINAKIASSCGSDNGSTDMDAMAFGLSCDFRFSQRLTIGDRGQEVMNLQMMLNRVSPETRVSATGAGSLGQETMYFGAKTAAAVAALQEELNINALAVGVFGANTRAAANAAIEAECDMDMDDDNDDMDDNDNDNSSNGDGDLMVSEGERLDDAFLFPGVVRLPVLSFELEAGDEDVTVDGLTFEFTGRVDRDIIDSVVLIDEDGNIFGDDESIDSDEEVEFNESFEIEEGETVMMTLAVNAVGDPTENDLGSPATLALFNEEDGDSFSFELVEVDAEGDVDGLPLTRGADIEVDDSADVIDVVEIDSFSVENDTDLRVGAREIELLSFDVNSVDNNDDDDEDIVLMSIRINNTGELDFGDDLENFYAEVDGDRYDAEVAMDDDYLILSFGSNGIAIENGEEEEVEVYADVVDGANDDINFDIENRYDVYAMSDNGYPAAVVLDGTMGSVVSVDAGEASLSTSSDEGDEDDIMIGTEQVIGLFDLEVEGDDLEVEELFIYIEVDNGTFTDGDFTDLLLENVMITDEDGNEISESQDAEVIGTASANYFMVVELDDVVFPEGDHENLRIVADVRDEVGNDTTYQVVRLQDVDPSTTTAPTTVTSTVDGFRGDVEIDDEDVVVSGSASFDRREVEASALTISLESADDTDTTDDVQNFTMAVLELDADESGEDIEVTSVEIRYAFNAAGSSDPEAVEDFTGCELFMEDSNDSVSNSEDLEEGDDMIEFDLEMGNDPLVVEAGETMKLDLRCNIEDGDLVANDELLFSLDEDDDFDVEGVSTKIDGDDFVVIDETAIDAIVIVANGIEISVDEDTPEDQVVKQGEDDVVFGALNVEGEDGSATIEEITVTIDNAGVIDDEELVLYVDGQREDDERPVGGVITFDGLSIDVMEDEEVVLEFRGDIDQNAATGLAVTIDVTTITIDDVAAAITVTEDDGEFGSVTAFEAVPKIELISDVDNDDLRLSNTDYEVLVFSVEADGDGDVVVDSVNVLFETIRGLTVSNAEMFVYEDRALSNEFGSDLEVSATVTEGAVSTFNFAADSQAITVDEGDTLYFVLEADVDSDGSDNGVLRVVVEDVEGATNTATTGINFSTPAINSAVLLSDDIEVSHSRD